MQLALHTLHRICLCNPHSTEENKASGVDNLSPNPLQLLAKSFPDFITMDPEYCLLSE